MQLLPSLLSELQAVCATFPDRRKGRGGNIAPTDFGLSAFAMFFMQSGSVLAYQRTMEKGHGRSNCRTLFGIGRIPSDNYIRDFLDEADPALLQPCFERMEALLSEPPMRQAFGRLGGRTLIALDGTEFFCSQKLGCPHCLTRKRANGKTESYHSMLSATVVTPGRSKVVPLMPEFVAPQDGAEKQDCERNAVKRWFSKHGARLAPLRPIFLGDDLFGCHPVAKMVTDAGDDFIFTCKETSHKALYDFIDGAELSRHEEKVRRRNAKETFRYRWIEAVPIRDGKDAILVNWIGFEIVDRQGKGHIFHGLGDQPSRLQGQCRRDRRLRPGALEDRKRELQRVEKPRLRTRTQFRPWPEVSRDDAGGPQSARLRLAHRARTARTTLAGRSRSGGQANQLLRPHPHVERLRNLSLLAGFPPIPRHLLDPARPHKSRRQSLNVEKVPTFRIAECTGTS